MHPLSNKKIRLDHISCFWLGVLHKSCAAVKIPPNKSDIYPNIVLIDYTTHILQKWWLGSSRSTMNACTCPVWTRWNNMTWKSTIYISVVRILFRYMVDDGPQSKQGPVISYDKLRKSPEKNLGKRCSSLCAVSISTGWGTSRYLPITGNHSTRLIETKYCYVFNNMSRFAFTAELAHCGPVISGIFKLHWAPQVNNYWR